MGDSIRHITYRAPLSTASGLQLPLFDYRFVSVGESRVLFDNTGFIGGFEFPKGGEVAYLAAGLLVGCVRGTDTLVTGDIRPATFNSMSSLELLSYERIDEVSALNSNPEFDPDARADQQLYAEASDTTILSLHGSDPIELRPHRPIGVGVSATLYAWGDRFTKRFVLVDYWVKNISNRTIEKAVLGIRTKVLAHYVDGWPRGSIGGWTDDQGVINDDICGFLTIVPGHIPGTKEVFNMAWAADADGDPVEHRYVRRSATGVIGVRIVRAPLDTTPSFNWWAYDPILQYPPDINWGPGRVADHVRYANSLGIPMGDRGNYHMMTNGEVDYDQVYAAIDFSAEGWRRPLNNASAAIDVADGQDVEYMLSFGPLPDIAPGDSVPLTVAFVAGANFHTDPNNFADNFDPSDPTAYLNNLNFSDLITNARWAAWVFDNPGVDTDGDGYRGEAYLVNCIDGRCDSVFYKGDGVPDWRGPSAPPPPPLEITTRPHGATLRWRGNYTETHADAFSGERDFEGYRLYLGRFDQNDQYSLISSWDKIDYERVAYDPKRDEWVTVSYPLTEAEWPEALGDPGFSVFDYTEPSFETAYIDTVQDTIRNDSGEIIRLEDRVRYSYWAPHGPNRANEYVEGGVVEENIIQLVDTRDTVIGTETFTYGVYEATLSRLNAAVPLYVAVTAFDYGDYKNQVSSQESLPTNNSEYVEFIYSTDVVIDSALKVSVFPNPYKLAYKDGRGEWTSYYREGYEGLGVREFYEQDRRIHFINLPDTATISIYTLDGDLVRRIDHPDPFLTTYPSSVGWDLVTRNVQAAVSGIYIWKVDSRLGSQTGKLVIIK
ncbi:MAG: hypothetical protein Kow0074_25150 [Candidatus Zixiibacteriota bacterium]